ncbi:MAG: DNA translocase FtsK, partial [Phycisphaerales bacterium]
RKSRKPEVTVDIADPDQEMAGVETLSGAEIVETKPGKKSKKPAMDEAAIDPEMDEAGEDAGATAAGTTVTSSDDADEDDGPGAAQVYTEDALREKIAKLPVVFGQRNKQVASAEDLALLRSAETEPAAPTGEAAAAALKPYQFPGLDLLENPEENFNAKLEEYVRDQATALESALQQYRIDGEVVGIESGPVITLFDVRLAPGTKVAALSAVSSDIARALKAVNIRIVPNQVGRDTVGVEVPNATKEKVRLKELMGKTEKFSSMKLPMFLGKDASGEPLIEDLTKMPHMLIAGTTGSGKSVCMNTIIMGFLYTKKPSELKLVLVDPKMVEMSQFKDIPHLMCPVVTEMSKAAAILEWATTKMDERYELLAEAGCRDIASYNDLSWDELKERMNPKTPEEEARIPRKLPYMVFIIDELADLMMTNKEVEGFIIRIAQKARAVGIHLILATQRPQANVVTGLIKSNMPCRIAFKVASGMDSRIVLDQKGGELLLGHGDMLILSPRSSKMNRAQGTLVDDIEIRRVVRFMRDVSGPSFERSLLQIRSAGAEGPATGLGNLTDEERLMQSRNNSSASLAAAQEDPLFPRAVEIVLETKRGSVSLLQRRLAIGYTRASRLIDLMGIAGIISDHKGSVARDVLITLDDWDAMKRLAAEEAKAKGLKSIEEASAAAASAMPVGEPGKLFAAGPEQAPFEADGAMPKSVTEADDRFEDAFVSEEEEDEGRR